MTKLTITFERTKTTSRAKLPSTLSKKDTNRKRSNKVWIKFRTSSLNKKEQKYLQSSFFWFKLRVSIAKEEVKGPEVSISRKSPWMLTPSNSQPTLST